mmetsp:Transcript_78329/g.221506  ORF Transcript_78329/g.221506 Transcript_78329/m.221506 type:complete len:123 (-) Transcript_78329:126-494(-)
MALKQMKPMKAAMKEAMKSMKGMKAAKRSGPKAIRAKGRMARSQVLRGIKEKTSTGLKASDLMKNKAGKIVSKKRSALNKTNPWNAAVGAARKALGLTGFVAINSGPQGKALYAKARAIFKM